MKRLFTYTLSLIAVAILSACSLPFEATEVAPQSDLEVSSYNGTLGLKTFKEYQTYLELTMETVVPESVYGLFQPQLSAKGRVSEANSSLLLAMTMLAGTYCSEFVKRLASTSPQSNSRTHLKGMDLASGSAYAQFKQNGTLHQQAIQELSEVLLQRSATVEENNILLEALFELFAEQTAQTARDLQALLTTLCTLIASSADGIRS